MTYFGIHFADDGLGAGYWTVRAWIAITEGGAIPATLVYLSESYCRRVIRAYRDAIFHM
jgi:hypothetical protein